jgi:C-terminal processing protease CtpA/Prc
VSLLPDNFAFRTVATPQGPVGYLRIYSFAEQRQSGNFVKEFVTEFQRILGLLPTTGLIIDVRGNGGGVIYAGELILQFLTAAQIQPEPFHLINTFATQQLCERVNFMEEWQESIALSLQTGAVYSQGFPITPPEWANSIGRIYQGPVVLITDALCYSTTDIFAAGFQDHNIGPILGVHGNTGAGGANVWTHTFLRDQLKDDHSFSALPANANFRVSLRQCTRVGRRAGLPVEDLGVRPDHRHEMTRRDLLEDNHDLILRAAALLFP